MVSPSVIDLLEITWKHLVLSPVSRVLVAALSSLVAFLSIPNLVKEITEFSKHVRRIYGRIGTPN